MTSNSTVLTQLHLGVGSFHRTHQAVYMQMLHDSGNKQWQIIGGNIRADMNPIMEHLRSQDFTYTLETVNSEGERNYQLISSIQSVVDWSSTLQGIIEIGSQTDTRIISFTVTESGYYLDDDGKLDPENEDIKGDISGDSCCTLYGAMTKILEERKSRFSGPVTLLNCDNLRNNGAQFQSGLQQYLTLANKPELQQWVVNNTSTPCTMVDRITPRPPAELTARILSETGRTDRAAVMSEDFLQWVIEDDFIAGRPAWEDVDVSTVSDVTPYEEAKIRILNASHSCIAWAGTLKGLSYIHEGMADPEIASIAHDYVTQAVIPCLERTESPYPLDLANYRDTVLQRFGNANIKDTNQRVAMDSFSKIPSFILPTIQESLASGQNIDSVMMLPALCLTFMQYDMRGDIPYEYHDTADNIALAKQLCKAEDAVAAFCSEPRLFGHLAGDKTVIDAMRRAYNRVEQLISTRSV